MSDNVLFVGIDGWDLDLADFYQHDWWASIRNEVVIVEIPKPGEMESGDIATASSPRLWGRIYTGCEPHTNGVLGFWEKLNEDGEIVKAEIDKDWLMENRCEKLVMYGDFRVPPLWDHVAESGASWASTATWFTYPLPDHLKEHIDDVGGWCLTDAPFPFDHDIMARERIAHPSDVFPDGDYLEEVGAGMRTPELAKEDPDGFYDDLLLADQQRYDHVAEQLDVYGEQNLTMLLTRGVDACAHKFRRQNDIRDEYPDRLQDGRENMKRVMDLNFDGAQRLWEEYDFDHLVIGGDHGCGKHIENGDLEFVGDDHTWPARFAILSDDVPSAGMIRAKYEDIAPTVLQLLDIKPPDVIEGASIIEQAKVESRLRDLGYAP